MKTIKVVSLSILTLLIAMISSANKNLKSKINCLLKSALCKYSDEYIHETVNGNKRIKLILRKDLKERSLRKRRRKGGNRSKEFWSGGITPSDLIDLQELEVELDHYRESIVFYAVEGLPKQRAYYYGEANGGKQTINLLSGEENDLFGSIVDTDMNTIYQFQPKYDGTIDFKPFTEFKDKKDEVFVPKHKYGFHEMENSSKDSGDTIDVMVVWTKHAECANSNLSDSCDLTNKTTSNMVGKIQLAIAETNVAFSMSGINTQLRLVHSYLDPTYREFNHESTKYALEHISRKFDGSLDDVHEKRAKYGADIVSLWIKSGDCGLSYGDGGLSRDYMFSVVGQHCATGYFSFGHEIGHNMGCNHDRGTANKCNENDAPNYGYRDKNSAFRDIMSYSCVAGQCDDNAGLPCARVQRFSNNRHKYEGLPIGDDNNNCAEYINNNLATIASFFASKTDEELANTKESKDVIREPTVCKQRGSPCNSNSLCCSGRCNWNECA